MYITIHSFPCLTWGDLVIGQSVKTSRRINNSIHRVAFSKKSGQTKNSSTKIHATKFTDRSLSKRQQKKYTVIKGEKDSLHNGGVWKSKLHALLTAEHPNNY